MKPKFMADFQNGHGRVDFPESFREMDAIIRADILRDWLLDLTAEYQVALCELFEFDPGLLTLDEFDTDTATKN